MTHLSFWNFHCNEYAARAWANYKLAFRKKHLSGPGEVGAGLLNSQLIAQLE
jgi:hypothetical protein